MSEQQYQRYYTIDSLRGVAALGVVLYHLYGALKADLLWLPKLVEYVFSYGYLGVPIFFVLSGFVIALSVGDSKTNAKYIASFAFRRSLRLDPPYWIALAIAVCLIYLKSNYMELSEPPPSIKTVIIHMFYLQDILNIEPQISVVYWTLCLEIQFYLVFILIAALSQAKLIDVKYRAYIKQFFLLLLGVLSLLVDYKVIAIGLDGTFIKYWHYFLIGVLAYFALNKGSSHQYIFFLWVLLEVALLISMEIKSYIIAAILVGSFVFYSGVRGKLDCYLHNPILHFFGKISYSLYLLHADIGWKAISLGKVIIGGEMSMPQSLALLLLGLLVSIVGAYILYRFVELPFMRFSQRFKV